MFLFGEETKELESQVLALSASESTHGSANVSLT